MASCEGRPRVDYDKVYTKEYFQGGKSFTYLFGGYRDNPSWWDWILGVLKTFRSSGRLLDVGCAYGFFLKRASKTFKVYGIDVSEHAVGCCRASGMRTVNVHDVEHPFPFPRGLFDVVTCFEVIEHLNYPELLVDNIWASLKKGGILFFSAPNYNLARKFLFRFFDTLDHHVSLMHIDELQELLESRGFVVVRRWTGIPPLKWEFPYDFGTTAYIVAQKE